MRLRQLRIQLERSAARRLRLRKRLVGLNPLIRLARWVLYRTSPHFHADDRGFTRREIVDLCEKAGFEVVTVKRYGVFAYALAGFPDHLPLLRWIPGSAAITRMMIKVDRILCATPVLSLFGFHIIVVGRPGGQPS